MDAHLFRLFCSAACPLLTGARLAKVQEPAEGVLTFNFELFRPHPLLGRKPQLVFRPGRKEPRADRQSRDKNGYYPLRIWLICSEILL